jgi:hypothetical protein
VRGDLTDLAPIVPVHLEFRGSRGEVFLDMRGKNPLLEEKFAQVAAQFGFFGYLLCQNVRRSLQRLIRAGSSPLVGDVAPDGQFLMLRTRPESAPRTMVAVLDWFEHLRRRLSTGKESAWIRFPVP